jgi:hypothetical protein
MENTLLHQHHIFLDGTRHCEYGCGCFTRSRESQRVLGKKRKEEKKKVRAIRDRQPSVV